MTDDPDPLGLLSNELRALVQGANGLHPTVADLDWNVISPLIVAHGVGPLLHRAWSDQNGPVPRSVLHDLQRMRHQSALHAALALRQRDEVVDRLQGADLFVLVLKGAGLGHVWYGDVSLRPFIDIDIMVDPTQLESAREALRKTGYVDVPHSRTPHHDLPLYRPDVVCVVELHHQLTRLPLATTPPFEALFRRSLEWRSGTSTIRTLGPEDTLLHLCLHVLSHVEHDHGWQLRHLCDIARHVKAFDIAWDTFAERAYALGALRGCRAVLGLTDALKLGLLPATQIDLSDGLELLLFPVPGPTEHRLLADFLAAVRQLDLGDAIHMVLDAVVHPEHSKEVDAWNRRTTSLAGIATRLLRESARDPRRLARQLQLWLPEARRRRHREELLEALLPSSKPSAVASSSRNKPLH